MAKPRRMPKLSSAGDEPRPGRVRLVPQRPLAPPRNRLGAAAVCSVALHAIIIAAFIITFPKKTPPEPSPSTAISMVFEPGAKKSAAPVTHKAFNQQARESAPRGRPARPQAASHAEAPRPTPQPIPAIKTPPVPPHPVPPPKPPAAKPQPPALPKPVPPKPEPPKPVPPKPVPPAAQPHPPVAPKPPPPAMPKVNLPPPPKPSPALPKPPEHAPALPKPAPAPPSAPAAVYLNLPPMPEFAPITLPPPPSLPPVPTPPPPQRRVVHGPSGQGESRSFGHTIRMGSLSYGGGGSGGAGHALNLAPPSSTAPRLGGDLTVKGDPGRNWASEFRQWVEERLDYPEMAAEQGQQGAVTVRFRVDRAGHVSALEMVTPTGYVLLNQDWLGLFRNADLPPLGPDAKSNTITVTATMHYVLTH